MTMPWSALLSRACLAVAPALLMACVAPGVVPSARAPSSTPADTLAAPLRDCHLWFARLDDAVERYQVRDAEAFRLPGFAQLRSNRFVSSFAQQATASPMSFAAWLEQMRALDRLARRVELANLPDSALAHVGIADRAWFEQWTESCAQQLSYEDQRSEDRRTQLFAVSMVPDAYSALARVSGLYALTKIPFGWGIARWQRETEAEFARHGSKEKATAAQTAVRYAPAPATATHPLQDTAPLFAQLQRDALGIPLLSQREQELLLDNHAPIFELASSAPYDRIGTIGLRADGSPSLSIDQATVYRRVAFVRDGDDSLIQLVYLAWFAERPRSGALDMLGGTLDGVIWRVTLDRHGRPLLFDSIHPCGCYHEFFPTAGVRVRPARAANLEWAFMPSRAPALMDGQRIVIRVASGSHYLTGVSASAVVGNGDGDDDSKVQRYQMSSDNALRSLPLPSALAGATRKSLYGADGMVAGSQRGERFVFWPMGISDAGAMRQWGHHATAFVGRRHFDDPDLIERRFDWRER